jgi:hypothetical protein
VSAYSRKRGLHQSNACKAGGLVGLYAVDVQGAWQRKRRIVATITVRIFPSVGFCAECPAVKGCLPKPAKSNGFLWITFQSEHSRRQLGSICSAAFPVEAPRARVPIDVCRPT